jgi:branched-chain amino acid transport system permease protein
VLLLALAIGLPLLRLSPDEALNSLINDKVLTVAIALFTIGGLAASWNLLGGYTGQISLGHAAFFGIGALVTRQMWFAEIPFPIAFVAGGLAATVAAVVVGIPALRLRGIYFSIGTLAMAEALRVTVNNTLPRLSGLRGPMLRSYDLLPRYYLLLAVLVLITVSIIWLIRHKIGLGMMAVREDEDAALAIGINVFRHKLFAFVLSAAFAGLVGAAFAYFHPSYYSSYTFGPVWSFDAIIVVFVGGIGTLSGPLIGALFFVLIRDVLATNLSDSHVLIFGVLFIAVVLVFPGGLLSIWQRLRQRLKPTARAVLAGDQA